MKSKKELKELLTQVKNAILDDLGVHLYDNMKISVVYIDDFNRLMGIKILLEWMLEPKKRVKKEQHNKDLTKDYGIKNPVKHIDAIAKITTS